MLRRSFVLAAALGPALGLASGASAWDRDIHLSIVRGAMGVSAAAEARVPLEYREAVFHEIVEPDPYDKDCTYHCSAAAPRDPATEAAKILAILGNPKIPLTKYQRAQTIGRYLHFVADAVSPLHLRQGAAPKLLNFFANQDFILFREARPISGELAAALRQRASEVGWANAGSGTTSPFIFRLVVNTTADALLLLPPRDAAPAPDGAPPVFLVNRIDNGTAGRATAGHYEKTGHTYSDYYDGSSIVNTSGGYDTWSWTPGSAGGGQSFYKPNLMERKGVQLVEMVAHQEASSVTLKAIFFNNNELCASRVALKAGAWSWALPDALPPYAITAVTIEAPADVLSRKLGARGWSDQCGGLKLSARAMRTEGRRVYGNGGGPPLFDAVLPEYDITHASGRARGTNFTPKNE